ncbi:hypothetical protein [Glycomyces xiaoerkulensis]|uniref:hypothetical protein n=1 Tax=Glycomyces xiaoerkulensis TaxID=2038139 RepID=UPI000C25B839|nr:hypothetical protein [Glycomyces xiaoerkulensis]
MSSSEQEGSSVVEEAPGVPRQGGPTADRDEPTDAPAEEPDAPDQSAVRLRRLAGVAIWALALVLAGSASAIVGLFRIFGDGAGWFAPAFITTGVVGMLLTMMAFATIRFKSVPWLFMGAASATLLAAFVMLKLA